MFSRTKGNARSTVTSSHDPVKRSGVRAVPSIISADLIVEGNLKTNGDIQIDGTVNGDVLSASMTIGEKATINGRVVAEELVVRGRIVGSICSKKIQLCSSSHVEGDILHQSLAVETGAFFEGNCRHSEDPLTAGIKHGQQQATAPGQPGLAHQPAPVATAQTVNTRNAGNKADGPVIIKNQTVAVKQPAAR